MMVFTIYSSTRNNSLQVSLWYCEDHTIEEITAHEEPAININEESGLEEKRYE
ncbi:hypothetical protein CWI38_0869p0020 [Hamiltosporidium tvaerminnensis]|uniref:Uncharacterized protein n=1 Tax=Hamiltosporidium tvaerminnensis TaxID=1176355 RepID=A0A4Q9LWG0_9MICR|nr:hypothetical protein CWI38_0869p0020 [Hamiltosporidium tvaerminnensis]